MANKTNSANVMNSIKIEKIILGVAGVAEALEKGVRLLKMISSMQPIKTKSKRRIPTWGVRPGLELGAIVTIRDQKKIKDLLKRFLETVENKIRRKQIADNHFSFGIPEYIDVPGLEYQRDIGIRGLDVTVVFARPGKRVIRKKIKKGRLPLKHMVKKEEIINFMKEHFKTEIVEKKEK
jgi:large subunit ribosomal protein L5